MLKNSATMHLNHKPGKIMQVDWAGEEVSGSLCGAVQHLTNDLALDFWGDWLADTKQGVHPTISVRCTPCFVLRGNYSALVLTVTISDLTIVVHLPST